jgi:hypothetical protein
LPRGEVQIRPPKTPSRSTTVNPIHCSDVGLKALR